MTVPRKSARSWVIGFGLLAAAFGIYVVTADNPSDAAEETAKRLAQGKRHRPEADFITGLWWAAVLNFGLALGLMAGAKWWARPLSEIPEGSGFALPRKLRWFGIALLAIVVLAGAMRWNLAHRSLWWDELWPTKYGVVGYYLGEPTDPLEERYFGEANWQRALWHYIRPMSHSVASFPARFTHVAWQSLAGPESPNAFSDFAVRFPTWLASVITVGLVGIVGWRWNRPVAGLLAALLLAIHPWHIRYGVDMRSYSWMLLWVAAGLLWLTLIFREGKSRWWPWLGFGLNQGLLVWSFPHAIFLAAGFAGIAVVLAFRTWRTKNDRWVAAGRWFVGNVVGAMFYLQIFGPNLVQMSKWLGGVYDNHSGHGLNSGLARELLCQWSFGVPWQLPGGEDSEGLVDLVGRVGSLAWPLLALIGGILLIGLVRLGKTNRNAALLVGFAFAVAVLHLVYLGRSEHFFYPRFLTYLLIPSALLFGVAADWTAGRRWVGLGITLLAFGGFSWIVAPQWKVLTTRPYAPMRDVADAFDSFREERDGPVIFSCYGHGEEMMPIYFPEVRGAISLAELQALVEEAESRDAELVVAIGYQTFNRVQVGDGFDWLDDPQRFELLEVKRGIVPEHTFRLLRYRPEEDRS